MMDLVNVLNIHPCEIMVTGFYAFMEKNYHLCLGS